METLNRQIAGVPVKVWLIVIAVAIALGLYLRRRNSATAIDGGYDAGTANDFYPEPISGTAGGGNGGGGVGQSETDLTPIVDAIRQVGTDTLTAIASIPVPASEPSPPLPAAAPPAAAPSMLATPPPPASVGSTGPQAAPPATVATPPSAPAGPVPGASFTWVFAAIAGLPAKSEWRIGDKSLFMQHLQARSKSYADWKNSHRPAACRVFGDCS